MTPLEKFRKQIDKIDCQIINLLSKRTKISKKVGDYKKKNNLKLQDKKREALIFKKIETLSKKYNINKNYINKLFKLILKHSKEIQE